MANNIIEVSDETFEDLVLKSDKPVLVDFWAAWCGPCKAISPLIEKLAEENQSMTFAKVDVDKNNLHASKAGVRGIPTLILYKNGGEHKRVVGADAAAIQAMIEAAGQTNRQ